MKHLIALYIIFSPILAWAADVVVCDPTHPQVPNAVTQYQQSIDPVREGLIGRPGFLIWKSPNNSMTPEQVIYMNQLRGQIDSLSGIPHQYWICIDANPVDGILESVREMTQAEKDALDAPEIAEQTRQQTFTDEIATNDLCDAELSVLAAKADALKAANQADIDAIGSIATAKTALTGMNNRYDAALRKIVKCVRARAR